MSIATTSKSDLLLSRLEIITLVGFSFFIIPLSFYPGIIDPGLSLRFILLSILVAVLAGFQLVRSIGLSGESAIDPPPFLAVCCAGYFAICLFSIIPSTNKAEAVFESAKVFLFCALALFSSMILRRSPAAFNVLGKAAIASSFFISLLGILEYWGIFRLIDNGWVSPGATMFNRNLLSSYLFLCLGFLLFAVVNCKGLWRFAGLVAGASVIYTLLATQTRAVWFGCGGGALVALIAVFSARPRSIPAFLRREKPLFLTLAILPLVIAAAVTFFKPPGSRAPSLLERAATVTNQSVYSNRERLIVWRKTVAMIKGHSFLGVGAGNWKIEFPKYGLGDLVHPEYTDMSITEVRPGNDFLWVAAESGVFGFLFYSGLFVLCGVYALAALLRASNRTSSILSTSLLFTIAGFAIISFFDFPKERVEHLAVFATILAAASSLTVRQPDPAGKAGTGHRAFFFAALACACGCLWIGALRLKGDINDAAMRSFWQNKDWENTINAADRASSAVYSVEPTSTPLAWYRGVANFNLGNTDSAFRDFAQARSFHPWHLNTLNDLAACYTLRKDRASAVECLSAALAVSPSFEHALVNLAAVYYNAGQMDSACSIITRCKSPHSDPRFDSFYKAISQKAGKGGCP
jgi:O-antigen ligase